MYRVGSDIGGTFTDLILASEDGRTFQVGKVLTTPDRPDDAVIAGIEAVLGAARVPAGRGDPRPPRHHALHERPHRAQGRADRPRHDQGLPRRGRDRPRAPLRHVRPLHAAAAAARAAPPALRGRRAGPGRRHREAPASIPARCGAWPTGCAPSRHRGGRRVPAPRVREPGPRAPGGARSCREALPEVAVTLSCEVVPEIREYERTSTTLANVYVQRLAQRYLERLGDRLRGIGVGGRPLHHAVERRRSATPETAAAYPVRLIESGPAAGALAAAHYGALLGHKDLLSFDMGGTTAKACVIDDGEPLARPRVRGRPRLPLQEGQRAADPGAGASR